MAMPLSLVELAFVRLEAALGVIQRFVAVRLLLLHVDLVRELAELRHGVLESASLDRCRARARERADHGVAYKHHGRQGDCPRFFARRVSSCRGPRAPRMSRLDTGPSTQALR